MSKCRTRRTAFRERDTPVVETADQANHAILPEGQAYKCEGPAGRLGGLLRYHAYSLVCHKLH